ncbi:family 5 extracellular solute-binding protein [Neobacillus bataviensis LMG 21833]|uniref:Family 5 extracellular solute-binding protein n=1 Tax=Neobacillus bataviensis LMG 21833 TaxID=1117379 RepID=K6DQM6_9BACI|nr:ABC transporter substrate-binding protein [Neobacillus bataviensis]EKN70644.1 family 5 extracellular solute-binding protein [Neobacillus bataviensis LMG 21833]
MKTKKRGLFIVILVLMLAMVGCSSGTSESTSKKDEGDSSQQTGGEIRVAYNAQPSTLDPHMNNSTATKYVANHIFETLVTFNSKYEPVPMLAESVEKSEDGKTYTFHLRKGVTFHNGKEMTAEDVVASMNRWTQKFLASESLLGKGATFEQIDKYTVVLKLQEPYRLALTALATAAQFPAIMPKEIIESAGNLGVTEIIGTGPFKFVDWKKDQYIHITKYEDYKPLNTPADGWSGKKEALVKDIYFDIVTDAQTRVAGIQTGQYDVALSLPNDSYEQIKADQNLKAVGDFYGSLYVYFNRKQGLFTDIKMRQAVNAALDAKEILLASFSNKDLYKLSHQYMIQEKWAAEAGKEEYNQRDLEKVKGLLQEAGYNGQEIRLITTKDYSYFYNEGVVIAEQLKKAGLNVKLDVNDYPTLAEKRNDPTKWEISVAAIVKRATPLELEILQPATFGSVENPQLAEMLGAVNTASSDEEMKRKWDEAQGYIWEYLPGVKFGDYSGFDATTNKLKGIVNFEGINLWNTTVSK